MSYAIVVSSKTGNTKLLADTILEVLDANKVNYCGKIAECAKEADTLFIGFWTDKGTCDENMKKFLNELKEKKIFLFGTAGFGESKVYFEKIIERVKGELDSSNEVIGSYMCQGKMPIQVRERYIALQKEHPADREYELLIRNFDQALAHPNEADQEQLRRAIEAVL